MHDTRPINPVQHRKLEKQLQEDTRQLCEKVRASLESAKAAIVRSEALFAATSRSIKLSGERQSHTNSSTPESPGDRLRT